MVSGPLSYSSPLEPPNGLLSQPNNVSRAPEMAAGVKPLARLCLLGLHSAQLWLTVAAAERREPTIQASGIWEEAKQPVKVIVIAKLSNATAQGAICPYFSLSGKVMEGVMRVRTVPLPTAVLFTEAEHAKLCLLRCLGIAVRLLRTAPSWQETPDFLHYSSHFPQQN